MKLVVFSDVHDHQDKLESAFEKINKEKAKAVIFCGDLCSLSTKRLIDKLGLKTYMVCGNAESEAWWVEKKPNQKIAPPQEEFMEFVIDGKKFAVTHFPLLAYQLVATKYYDFVFYGDSHVAKIDKLGDCYLVNPGCVSGIVRGKYKYASVAVCDTDINKVKIVKI